MESVSDSDLDLCDRFVNKDWHAFQSRFNYSAILYANERKRMIQCTNSLFRFIWKQILAPGNKYTILLNNGKDVTKNLFELPPGTCVIIRREDGESLRAQWDGERVTVRSKCKFSNCQFEVYFGFLYIRAKTKIIFSLIFVAP